MVCGTAVKATNTMGRKTKRVCVIGAGPSGLAAARELRREGLTAVVLEQNRDVGGQWLYQKEGGAAGAEVHSSVYASLRLASPREIMGFTDMPFAAAPGADGERDPRRFPGHRELLLYLRDFCDRFRLRDAIRLGTRVERVSMVGYGGPPEDLGWAVRSRGPAGESAEEAFDAVVVATGHYSQPRLPAIAGMDSWRRKQLHSHAYRVPDPFRDEVVVVVGSSLSGQDISMELVEVAREVHLSSKSSDVSEGLSKVISRHDNLHLRPEIESLHEDGRVCFMDGSRIVVDAVVYRSHFLTPKE